MIKWFMDVALSGMALLLLLTAMGITAAMILLKMGRPIFFRQLRLGYQGNPFTIIKFRTMSDTFDSDGNLLPDEQRLTPFGHFLRQLSLDELPEIINILRGEMSLVGPRPLPVRYKARFTSEQFRRHSVKPGITGWAQVNGRNAISWEDKFKLDVWYVDNWSLWLDLRIILMTAMKVLKREGINQKGEATMEEFMGHAKAQRR